MAVPKDLTPRQAAFVREYLIDRNATRACKAAGYSAKAAETQGPRLLTLTNVKAAIDAATSAAEHRSAVKAERILQELAAIAFADARELTEHHQVACRRCWGKDHAFQHTDAEVREYRQSYELQATILRRQGKIPEPMEERLGGYDPKRKPNKDCPACAGHGLSIPVVNDTRHLSADAAALFAGVRKTRDGLEVKMHDKLRALELLARCKGMLDKPEEKASGAEAGSLVVRWVPAQPPEPVAS